MPQDEKLQLELNEAADNPMARVIWHRPNKEKKELWSQTFTDPAKMREKGDKMLAQYEAELQTGNAVVTDQNGAEI